MTRYQKMMEGGVESFATVCCAVSEGKAPYCDGNGECRKTDSCPAVFEFNCIKRWMEAEA